MEAKLVSFSKFLKQTDTRFIIPVYQRNYDWTETQCRQLFEDIIKVGSNDKMISHFIGSIVFIQDSVYSSGGITELTIIDGQQRLTTLSLLLLALSQKIKESGDDKTAHKILKDFIINEDFDQEKLKLRPIKKDDLALKFIIENDIHSSFNDYSRIIENFNYFKNKINNTNIDILRTGIEKLVFVEVSLERGKDDPQRIFESLNSTGLDLSQADLIRNYVLMDLSADKQSKIYEKYWLPIEQFTTDSNSKQPKLSEFIRDYLSFKFREIPNKNKVFEQFKLRYDLTTSDNETILADLKIYAKYYDRLINPENESIKSVADRIKQINKLEINVSYPFLLEVYHDFSSQIIDLQTFINVLDLIQSFVWRRFICNLPTNALNKIFVRLYQEIDKMAYLKSLEISLVKKRGQQRFPKDDEVEAELKIKDFYNIQSKNRRYFLEQLENYDNQEPVMIEGNNDITIEHILPQNPSTDWYKNSSKTEIERLKDKYLHTIANLTLSGNNSELSNKTFLNKRDADKGYKNSRLFLNKYLANIDDWNEQTILERLKIITERTLKIWYYPDIQIDDEEDEMNIFEIEDATRKNIDYVIFSNQKLTNITYYTELLQKVATDLFELEPNLFFSTKLTDKLKLTQDKTLLGSPIPISSSYFIEGHGNANAILKRLRTILEAFEMEDELTIKFK